jgi:hypothetical protein
MASGKYCALSPLPHDTSVREQRSIFKVMFQPHATSEMAMPRLAQRRSSGVCQSRA